MRSMIKMVAGLMPRTRLRPGLSGRAIALCAGLGLLFAGEVRAQTNETSRARWLSNRYLLIVETSRAMKHREAGVSRVVQDLVSSGMKGQVHPGDTLGIWTYNKELITGTFPLEEWTTNNQGLVTLNVQSFVESRKLTGQPKLDGVLAELAALVRDSEFLTVILVSSGEGVFRGTRFDEKINAVWNQWREAQQKANQPFVTVLRSKKGEWTDCVAAVAPWVIEMPSLPNEMRMPLPKPVVVATPEPEPPMGEPLILSGKKPVPTPISTPPQTNSAPPVVLPAVPSQKPPAVEGSRAVIVVQPPVTPQPTPTIVPPVVAAPQSNTQPIASVIQVKPAPAPIQVPPQTNAVLSNMPLAGPVSPVPEPERAGSWAMVLVGCGLGVIGTVLAMWFLRSHRNPNQPSLITQTMDRESRNDSKKSKTP